MLAVTHIMVAKAGGISDPSTL